MTRWNKTQEILQRIGGVVRRVTFVRRKAKVGHTCSECRTEIAVDSLFWKRWHRSIHIECFEELKRRAATLHMDGRQGRKPVLDDGKQEQVANELTLSSLHGTEPNYREIGRKVNVSERTIRRFAKGDYLRQTA